VGDIGAVPGRVKLPNDMGSGYPHPVTGRLLIGVTSLIKWAVAKPFLTDWAAGMVANRAVEYVYEELALRPKQSPDQLRDWFKAAPSTSNLTSSQNGDILHDWAKRWHEDTDLPLPDSLPENKQAADLRTVRKMAEHYRDLCLRWKIQAISQERTVVNDTLGIAGTYDIIFTSPYVEGGRPVMGDRKTTNGVKPRADITYQLPCYGSADLIHDYETGISEPMVDDVSQDRGYVIKTKETGAGLFKIEYRLPKYNIDMYREIQHAVEHFRWAEHADKMVSGKLEHPDMPRAGDVDTRITGAESREELEAIWTWAVTEGVWDPERHLPLIEEQKEQL
jgi:hypothetical protein